MKNAKFAAVRFKSHTPSRAANPGKERQNVIMEDMGMKNANWWSKRVNSIKVSEFAMLYAGIFDVVVKEEGECYKYSCKSNNQTQHDDMKDRTIYKINQTTDGKVRSVYCW